jgi:hypothetical protein
VSRSERTGLPGTVKARRDYRRVTVGYRLATGLTGRPERHRDSRDDEEHDRDSRDDEEHGRDSRDDEEHDRGSRGHRRHTE